jgi:predicted  nucleic acid-binding Zn ribbon protein
MTSMVLRVRFGLPAHRISFCQYRRLKTALQSAKINLYCDRCSKDWLLEMAVSMTLLFSSNTNSITSVLNSSLM